MAREAWCHAATLAASAFTSEAELVAFRALLAAPTHPDADADAHAAADDNNHHASGRPPPPPLTLQREEELASRVGLSATELAVHLKSLEASGLAIKWHPSHAAADVAAAVPGAPPARGASVPTARSSTRFWGLNFEHLANVVHFKVSTMRRQLDERLRAADENQTYRCARCGTSVDGLGITAAMMSPDGSLVCEMCGSELEEEDYTAERCQSEQLRAALGELVRPILAALAEAEEMGEPPVYKRARPSTVADDKGTGDSSASRGHAGVSGGRNGGVEASSGSSLGASCGIAVQRGEAKAVPVWMQTEAMKEEAAAAEAEAEAEAEAAKAAGTDDVSAREWEERARESISMSLAVAPVAQEKAATAPAVRQGSEAPGEAHADDDDDEADPMVSVGGELKPFSEVDEEDQALMSAEEHAKFAQLYQELME